MSKIDMTKVKGKYAEQRVEFLENHAPDILSAMVEDGSIYEHLNFVQDIVREYVNGYVDKMKLSEEYQEAERECDLAAMNKLITTAVTTAEFEVGSEWIYAIPDVEEESDSEEDEKSFEDMSYIEAINDIYNDINNIRSSISELEMDETEEE